jgi:hypothetical protein
VVPAGEGGAQMIASVRRVMDSWKGISSQHSHQRRPSCYHNRSFFPKNFAQLFDELFRGSLHYWLGF